MVDWSKYPNFSKEEFDCSHTGKNKMRSELLDVVQQIRDIIGKPLAVTSGYRDPSHPVEARKSNPGEHTYGLAADIAADPMTLVDVICAARGLGVTRIGINLKAGFVHVGVGDQYAGFPATPWGY